MHIPTATVAFVATLTVVTPATVVGHAPQKPATPAIASPLSALWQQSLPVSGDSTRAPALVAGDAVVVVAYADTGLSAYASSDGRPMWSDPLAPLLPPVLAEDVVVVATHGALRALSLDAGRAVWQAELEAAPSTLVALGDRVGAVIGTELSSSAK